MPEAIDLLLYGPMNANYPVHRGRKSVNPPHSVALYVSLSICPQEDRKDASEAEVEGKKSKKDLKKEAKKQEKQAKAREPWR